MKKAGATAEGRRAEQSLRKAVSKVIEENRRLGIPVAVKKDGEAVLISAEQALGQVREAQAEYKIRKRK